MVCTARCTPGAARFLFRLWRALSAESELILGQASTWRFSLEKAGTDERRAFPDLEALVAFLERELGCEDAGASGAGAASAHETL